MVPNKDHNENRDNSESQNLSSANERKSVDSEKERELDTNPGQEDTVEGYYSSPPDKYLAMEQPGVTYTDENTAPLLTSDDLEDGMDEGTDVWDAEKKNSRNSEAFNQDEYILNENIDFDEDQNQSISSDDI
ncbi:MAG TPA: hypothetical protein VF581_03675 [Flavobacterium sp.]|jgi:hypothetical protein